MVDIPARSSDELGSPLVPLCLPTPIALDTLLEDTHTYRHKMSKFDCSLGHVSINCERSESRFSVPDSSSIEIGSVQRCVDPIPKPQGNVENEPELKREMLPRHLQMISVAGAFGTGLIISSGTALLRGGPGSLLISYILMGANVYFVMTALAEMATYAKMDKGFPGYATRFADPALG